MPKITGFSYEGDILKNPQRSLILPTHTQVIY